MELLLLLLLLQQYLFGAVVAFLLGFLLLFAFQGKRKEIRRNAVAPVWSTRKENGEYSSENTGNDAFDVIVVGAGVAGAALACTLGKDGRRVCVIERDLTEPDRIVGELLQPGGYLKLMELGLQDCVEEIDAQRVLGYALFKDGKNTRLAYPLEKFHSDVAGRSFHNGRFIQRMREKVASLPNVRLEQGTVTSLIEENGTVKGVLYKTKTGEELIVHAPLTVVCDGCFSNLRRTLCSPQDFWKVPSRIVFNTAFQLLTHTLFPCALHSTLTSPHKWIHFPSTSSILNPINYVKGWSSICPKNSSKPSLPLLMDFCWYLGH